MSDLTFPAIVMLRNRDLATVETAKGDAPWIYIGRLGIDIQAGHRVGEKLDGLKPAHHCWRRDGRWHESGQPTPLDIVGIAVGRNGEALEFAAYGPASGAKGGA